MLINKRKLNSSLTQKNNKDNLHYLQLCHKIKLLSLQRFQIEKDKVNKVLMKFLQEVSTKMTIYH